MMISFELTGFADEAAVDLAGQVRALVRNGMSYVDVRQVDGINVADFTPDKAAEVHRVFGDAGIRVACVGSPIGKVGLKDPFPVHLEKLRRTCSTAHVLGTRLIRIFSFYLPEGVSRPDCREEVIERMGHMLDIAAVEGCTLLHENERDIYGETWEQCLDLLKAFDGRLRAIHDSANFVIAGSDPLAGMKALLEWVDYLHVKDARIAGGIIVPAGHGDGSYPEVLSLYATRPGPRFLSIEPHLTLFSGRDSLEKKSSGTPTAADGFTYPDAETAFSAAVQALRTLLPAVAAYPKPVREE
jgi:sugar phosphate isomerase/epimerase